MIKLNKKPNILVIGDLMIDHYLWGSCDRISPEAPVQVVNVKKESSVLGGAGNVINNLVTLGSVVDVISVIGNDSVANELKSLLEKIDVPTSNLVVENNRKTSKKSRLIASQQQVLRYDMESIDDINENSHKQIIQTLEKNIDKYSSIILSDYGKGVLTTNLTKEIIKIANKNSIKVLVDPKGKDYSKYKGSYTLTPNKKEAMEATNIDIKDESSLIEALKSLKTQCELEVSLITLSEQGIAIFDDELTIKPTVAREVYDVTGAGDTVIASIAFALGNNLDIKDAIYFANLAAGVVVGKIGSATTTLDEIYEYEYSLHKSNSTSHIKTFDEIKTLASKLHNQGKKIVFTNGCFDILHVGHVKYLEVAKSYGDVLILGLNADSSVRKLKGPTRPINTQDDRAYILASLESVDYVVIFEEETPYELIKLIKPHVLVKGGDYEGKEVVGQDIADELKLVQFVDGKSTTNTIKRIQENEKCNN
ncbi:D-glycero-beta-D-manno-heptose-7-phosphate kinase [Arcobacter cryaerophilus gv. pseudocryaerophilus]|jgi:D-beta-D-heptose 7-phosphate kinase/D-beta-D-heptose 1-phosphate adenosyltransferase|uniref:Bifunctional protein HldE n=3 Tax=unclassified Arcobacter TaxID=2593671 RepID=A0AA96IL63_9BACT|nr:D-glycero-beta-D-manno-heptose-7-phosphate kinase [Arcobacter sp. AZ-2023]WPD06421.1 D-glycero-beta-D-manno-heptose-7-phosphate kinase [Arcobacter sp. DSM 115956]WPD08512.1 D-glycero-beta-D-manno-heptose-7-phosphate kinase [Arcobacter sp. DSM 115955]WNL32777.1 D-glycero-beta-D-manno-heptose-7-phosphate kinase [Arcobacter sp. AZ-2023]WNP38927.1 D-glycero-beta-D-manno-heptose-7-phosphate kinase [Arcobacter sp. AZ-2023]